MVFVIVVTQDLENYTPTNYEPLKDVIDPQLKGNTKKFCNKKKWFEYIVAYT